MAGPDPFQRPGGDPWANGRGLRPDPLGGPRPGKGQGGKEGKGGKDGKGKGRAPPVRKGGGKGQGQGLREGVRQQLETRMQDLMNDILNDGCCPTSAALLDGACTAIPAAREEILKMSSMELSQLVPLNLLVPREQALKQFLLSMRSLCNVWSVKDAERAFIASSFVKRFYDVENWSSLRIGPSLSKHPLWAEVFWEFQDAQWKWISHEVDPAQLMDGVAALELLFQHRVDSSGLNGKIDFEKDIRFEDFQQWLYSRGLLLEDCGVCINQHKFGLVMGAMNGALAQQDRLQQEAEKKWLEKLLQLAEDEVETLARQGCGNEEQAAYEDFHRRWRKAARSQTAAQLEWNLRLWAQHKLGRDCDAKPLRPLAMALAVELKTEGAPDSLGSAAMGLGSAAHTSLSISPLELEETVRRQLEQVLRDGQRGLAALQRLERLSLGVGASMEDLLPGEGTFLNFLNSKPQLREMLETHLVQARTLGGAASAEDVDVSDLLRKADEVLLELRPSSSVLDLQLLEQLEERLRCPGLRLGELAQHSWGSVWATRVQDVKAFDLLQSHANFVSSSCGSEVAYRHHFGLTGGGSALGLPPQRVAASESREGREGREGLHFEAAVLGQLHSSKRMEVSGHNGHTNGSLASMEARAASRAAEDLAQYYGHTFQEAEETYISGAGRRHATIQQGFEALAQMDFLEDVETNTSWQALFAPSLGSLEDFLSHQVEQLHKHQLRFLVLAPGSLPCASLAPRLVRLPCDASVEALQQAVAEGQAKTAAAMLTALGIEEPHNVEALVYYFREGLKALKQRFESQHSASAVASSLAVAVLQFLPSGLRPHLGKLVVLPCLKEEVAWSEECRSAANRLGCSNMLLALGQLWDVRCWTSDMPSQTQSGELHFLSALGISPAAATATLNGGAAVAASKAVTKNRQEKTVEKAEVVQEIWKPSAAEKILPPTALEDTEKLAILRKIRQDFCLDSAHAAQLQRNLGGALKRLGEDLYREQHHFVFELLQNGDDNKYPETEIPCYKLILCENMLVALSNEVGFEQANVESLCSVDSSTKPQLSDGAERIGRKGIGFKSVFKITDTPIIHSAGWHFRFNAGLKLATVNIKELGYIVPEEVAESDMKFPHWTTEIRLPFKKELGNDEKALLNEDFKALDGTLLLNLNKLRCLVLQQCNSSQISEDRPLAPSGRCLRSTDLCTVQRYGEVDWRLVQISDGEVRNWLCAEGAFPFSNKDPKMVKLKISFPLPVKGSLLEWQKDEQPTLQQTFCYLPLRSFGWRVVLHANFNVTASRNELHCSAWNRKIKELLPKMMCWCQRIIQEKLMPSALAAPFSPLPWLKPNPALDEARPPRTVPYGYFLRFMPVHGDLGGGAGASDFFAGTEAKIWHQLKEEKCVLSAEGCWMQPCYIFQAPEVMKKVIGPEILAKFHDGLCYMHSDFGAGLSAKTLQHLGVRTPGSALDVLLTVLTGMVGSPEGNEVLSVGFVRQVLALYYSLMWGGHQDEVPVSDSLRLEKLKKLRLLPLQRSTIAGPPGLVDDAAQRGAVAEEGLFLPDRIQQSFPQALLDCLDLKIVSPELFEGKDGQLVRRLLDHLGLRLLSPDAVVLEGVMPLLEKLGEATHGEQEVRTVSLCIAYLASVRMAECAEGWARKFKRQTFEEALQTWLKLPILLDGQLQLQPVASSVPTLLSSTFHLLLATDAEQRGESDRAQAHKVLAEVETTAVTAPQLLEAADEMQLAPRQLAQFLAQHCGVTMGGFPVQRLRQSQTLGELGREKPQLKEVAEQLARDVDSNILAQTVDVVDFDSRALAAALNSGSDVRRLLVASYVVELRDHLAASLTLKATSKSCPSSIAALMTNSSWVQGSGRSCKPCHARFLWEDGQMPSPDSKLTPEVKRFLEKHLVLVGEAPCCQLSFREMLKQLGAQQLSAKDVLELLRDWSTTKFESTEGEMTSAYQSLHLLQQHRRCLEVEAALKDQDEKLIFVPNETKLTKKQQLQSNLYRGEWLSPSACCVMEDRRVSKNIFLLSRLRAVRELELHYSSALKDPFLKTCGIAEWPTEMHRLHSLEVAARTMAQNVALRLAEILLQQLFEWAGPGQERRQNEQLDPHYAQELRRGFAKYHALPTNQGWMAWRFEHEGEDPMSVEIFLPDVSGRNGGHIVLDRCLSHLLRHFQQLGMRSASHAAASPEPSPAPSPEPSPEEESLEVEGEQQESPVETKLRVAMAYLQCWLHKVDQVLCHALDARAGQLSSIHICVAERLALGGREVDAHFAELMLYMAQPTDETRLRILRAAVQQLLLKALALTPQQAALAENLGIEVLTRLTESQKPGLAAQRVLQHFGFDDSDPAQLPLTWWFHLPPLELEDPEPTLARGSAGGPSAIARQPGPNGWIAKGGSGAPAMGHSHGLSHAPMAPQAAEEGDPWANWVGLSAEHAPLLREAVTLARRAGRPHEGLEAYADELEAFARCGASGGHSGHASGSGEAHGQGGLGGSGAQWAERRAREVEDFLAGLGPDDANSAVFHQLRIHSAQLRALAAPGALPEANLPPAAEAAAAAANATAEATFLAFEGDFHLQQGYAVDEMEALEEDAPNDRAFPTTGRLSPEEERQVAEWGEEWVFKTLVRKYRERPDVRVQWLNQQNEQFDFYDIALQFPHGRQEFYEVKTTVTTDKRLLEVSEKQVLEASKLKDRFNIVRVFGAGNIGCARMLLVPNPSEKCRRKAATGIELLLKLP